jgi:hypothetical protein
MFGDSNNANVKVIHAESCLLMIYFGLKTECTRVVQKLNYGISVYNVFEGSTHCYKV